ncbi:TMhelix containing protein [Vibrio phage 1.101.O._10N.261.45.C6]|nr:TMhelix containing protein [Vibrio phage 1.101.O._10N.261.45.C6]
MKINLTYKDTGFGYHWVLTTGTSICLCVDYVTKPTKKQIRRQMKAVIKRDLDSWGKRYCRAKGKMVESSWTY